MGQIDSKPPKEHQQLMDATAVVVERQRKAHIQELPDGNARHSSGAIIKRIKDSLMDGWANLLTGLGTSKDARMANFASWGLVLYEEVAENLYAADPLARRIVELLPNDATRQGYEFKDEEKARPLKDELKRLDWDSRAKMAWEFARLYGGAGVCMIEAGIKLEDMDKPMQPGAKIESLVTLSRWELWTYATEIQRDITKPDYGNALKYRAFPRQSFGQVAWEIHASRVIRFDGKSLPRLLHLRNNFWGDSVLTALWEPLADYKATAGYVANALRDFRVMVHKIKGLASSIAAGKEQLIKKRLAIMAEARSVIGALAIDAEDDAEFSTGTLSGIREAADIVKERLAADTDMPHSILFNEGAGKQKGLGGGGNGDHEELIWFDVVKEKQEHYLRPRQDQLIDQICSYLPGVGKREDNPYEFNSLWQMDDSEKADTDYKNAQADQIYANLGVRTAEAIQKQRFPEEHEEAPANPEFMDPLKMAEDANAAKAQAEPEPKGEK